MKTDDGNVTNDVDRAVGKVARPRKRRLWSGRFVIISFGIVWPLITIWIELTTGMSAEMYVDPMPTWVHLGLLFTVPAAAAYGIYVVSNDWDRRRENRAWIFCGFALGVASIYSLLFIPIAPFAVLAIVVGLGLLALTPFACVIGLAVLAAALGRLRPAHESGKRAYRLVGGMMAAGVVLVGMELPGWIATIALLKANDPNPEIALEGVRQLRRYTSPSHLAALLEGGTNDRSGLLLPGVDRSSLRVRSWNRQAALLYRVTGRSQVQPKRPAEFLSLNREIIPFDRGRFDGPIEDFSLRGTDVIGPIQDDLSLADSRLDGIIDSDAAVGYFEWTITLSNAELNFSREARSLIRLPHDGVVSRLTLWIDGEEREAAFAAVSKTVAAYQDVAIVRQRDPVLVTTYGADLVLVRCFPVPAGGEMKLRIGISAPLQFDSAKPTAPGSLELPRIIARNFELRTDHELWIEADGELSDEHGGFRVAEPSTGTWTLRGEQDPDAPRRFQCAQDALAAPCYAADIASSEQLIVQTVETEVLPPLTRVAVVVDGSYSMRGERERIATLLNAIDESLQPVICIVEEGVAPQFQAREAALETLADHEFVGGLDNVPALEAAWDLAFDSPGSAVLWIRGTQPVELTGTDGLLQRYVRGKQAPPIFEIPLVEGEHRVADHLANQLDIGYRRAAQDRLALVSSLHSGRASVVRRFRTAPEAPQSARESTSHIVRLWAASEVRALGSTEAQRMTELAAARRIVTPLTGAVVLETQRQYERHELDPSAEPRTVPSIPEPGEWALIILCAGMLWWVGSKRRENARVAA